MCIRDRNIYSDYCQRFKAGKNKLYLEDQSMAANMGDYNTLANFISWGTSKYKANHYMLILSGAGGGLMNGMAYDELNGNDSLNLEEISYGISAAGVNFEMCIRDSNMTAEVDLSDTEYDSIDVYVWNEKMQPYAEVNKIEK